MSKLLNDLYATLSFHIQFCTWSVFLYLVVFSVFVACFMNTVSVVILVKMFSSSACVLSICTCSFMLQCVKKKSSQGHSKKSFTHLFTCSNQITPNPVWQLLSTILILRVSWLQFAVLHRDCYLPALVLKETPSNKSLCIAPAGSAAS